MANWSNFDYTQNRTACYYFVKYPSHTESETKEQVLHHKMNKMAKLSMAADAQDSFLAWLQTAP